MPDTATHKGVPSAKPMPSLLLHCCCAPCASSVIERLMPRFVISLLFYNPNIKPYEEYEKRASELRRLAATASYALCNEIIISGHCAEDFDKIAAAYPQEPEGGSRCRACYALRLKRTAELAKNTGFDYFATTLSVSPHKNASALNDAGGRLALEHGVAFLGEDFKKQDGYRRSVELSKVYKLYRQSYCGCQPVFGKNEKEGS